MEVRVDYETLVEIMQMLHSEALWACKIDGSGGAPWPPRGGPMNTPNPEPVRWPADWSVLTSDNGTALVVPEGTDPAEALVELIAQMYGGEDLDPTHPEIVAEVAKGLRVERWRAYSRELAEAEGVDCDDYTGWYGPNGDVGDWVHAFYYDGDAYDLGERIHAAQLDGSGDAS